MVGKPDSRLQVRNGHAFGKSSHCRYTDMLPVRCRSVLVCVFTNCREKRTDLRNRFDHQCMFLNCKTSCLAESRGRNLLITTSMNRVSLIRDGVEPSGGTPTGVDENVSRLLANLAFKLTYRENSKRSTCLQPANWSVEDLPQ